MTGISGCKTQTPLWQGCLKHLGFLETSAYQQLVGSWGEVGSLHFLLRNQLETDNIIIIIWLNFYSLFFSITSSPFQTLKSMRLWNNCSNTGSFLGPVIAKRLGAKWFKYPSAGKLGWVWNQTGIWKRHGAGQIKKKRLVDYSPVSWFLAGCPGYVSSHLYHVMAHRSQTSSSGQLD